mgnify:CR=1 FL=1
MALGPQDEWLRRRQLALHVASKVIQDRLPACTLLLLRVRRLAIEGYSYGYAFSAIRELHNRHAIAEGILDQLILNHLRVCAREVESERTVFGCHA